MIVVGHLFAYDSDADDRGTDGRGIPMVVLVITIVLINGHGANGHSYIGCGGNGHGANGRGYIGCGANGHGANGHGYIGCGANGQGENGHGFIGRGMLITMVHNDRGASGYDYNCCVTNYYGAYDHGADCNTVLYSVQLWCQNLIHVL